MKAVLILQDKFTYKAGTIELVVWAVPKPVRPSQHGFKYRLVYVVNGARKVGYDNERGKGDHKHIDEQQQDYVFVDVQTLIADFWGDVENAK
jgi:hypothetical protein